MKLKRTIAALLVAALLASQSLAATLYVRSTDGSDSDNGTTWALAKATLTGAFAIAVAGDRVWVSDNHAESTAGAVTLTSAGTAASPIQVLCGDDAAEPPTALATTATVSTSGTGNLTIASGFAYYDGITFVSGSSGNRTLTLLSTANPAGSWFKNCSLQVGAGSSGGLSVGVNSTGLDDQIVVMDNTTIRFAGTSQRFTVRCPLVWKNSTGIAGGGTTPTTLFATANDVPGTVRIRGVDLSAFASGKNLVDVATATSSSYLFQDCKLGASVAITTGTPVGQGGATVTLVNCDSGDTNYRFQKHSYQGDVYSESTIVRTGGASDGTTAISRRMASSANAKFYSPLEGEPIYAWNETTGSAITVTVETVTDNVTLTDAEAWVEVEYLGTSGFPLASTTTDRAATIIATPANQTSSSVTWTTTGLTTPVKQKLSASVTPQEKGLLRITPMLAKASTTMYYCPKADVQ